MSTQVPESKIEFVWRKAAHDLVNPLCGMNLVLQLWQKEMPNLLDAYKKARAADLIDFRLAPELFKLLEKSIEDQRNSIQYCQQYIKMVTMKVKDLGLEYSQAVELQCKSCVEKALNAFIPLYDLKHRYLLENNMEDFVILGNEELIKYIIFNLSENADYFLHCASQEGKIIITTSNTTKYNQLHYKDTGVGIAAENLPHIFEKYFSTVSNRMGLGLYFCQRAMQIMGGNILCHSEFGKYTEFVLQFPKK